MSSIRKRRSVTKLLTTSAQDIYVAPPHFECDVVSILVTNLTASSVEVTLQIYNAADATTFDILKEVLIPANSILQIDNPLFFLVNDKLRGLASATSSVNVTVSVNEESSRKN